MTVTVAFQDVAVAARENFRAYLEQKQARLAKLLTHYPPGSVGLQVHAVYFRHHNAFEVTLHLTLPGAPECYSREVSHLLHKALDLAFDALEAQVVRTLSRRKSGKP